MDLQTDFTQTQLPAQREQVSLRPWPHVLLYHTLGNCSLGTFKRSDSLMAKRLSHHVLLSARGNFKLTRRQTRFYPKILREFKNNNESPTVLTSLILWHCISEDTPNWELLECKKMPNFLNSHDGLCYKTII